MSGCIEVICGPMFAGKTKGLIRRLRREQSCGARIQAFKPAIDNRYGDANIVSHDASAFEATPVDGVGDLEVAVRANTHVVGIDEVQFFDVGVAHLAQDLANRGVRVIVAGLDVDYRAEPFGPMTYLLAVAETVVKLRSVCACGREAVRSRRKSGGGSLVEIGGADLYEPVCRACFVVR